MERHGFRGYGETQTSPSGRPFSRICDAIKWPENALQGVLGYAIAVIANTNDGALLNSTLLVHKCDLNCAALSRVFDGIAHDVLDRAAQKVPHAGNKTRLQRQHLDGAIPAPRFKVGVRRDLAHERIKFDIVAIYGSCPSLPTGKCQQVPDEFIEPSS